MVSLKCSAVFCGESIKREHLAYHAEKNEKTHGGCRDGRRWALLRRVPQGQERLRSLHPVRVKRHRSLHPARQVRHPRPALRCRSRQTPRQLQKRPRNRTPFRRANRHLSVKQPAVRLPRRTPPIRSPRPVRLRPTRPLLIRLPAVSLPAPLPAAPVPKAQWMPRSTPTCRRSRLCKGGQGNGCLIQ